MDDFPGLLARDFGFRPQGKAAPMSSSRGPTNAGAGSGVSARTGGWNSTPSDGSDSLFGNQDVLFGTKNQRTSQDYGGFDDIFGGLPRGAPPSSSSPPVYDKPVYDDDIFDGVPGIKSSGAVKYNDVFSSMSTGPSRADQYDDLLAGFGRSEADSRGLSGKQSADREKEASEFDDLIPGFGGSSPPQKRENSETNRAHPSTFPSAKSASSVPEDPFVVLEPTSVPVYSPSGLFADPLEHINRPSNTNSTKVEGSSAGGTVFDDIDAFEGLTLNGSRKDASHLKAGPNMSPSHSTASKEVEKTSVKTFENIAQKKAPVDDRDSHPNLFDMPTGFTDSHGSVGRSVSRSKDVSTNSNATSPHVDMSPKSEENAETADDVWLTVDEIPLFTQPTSAPPPSRPPPPFVAKAAQTSKPDRGSTVGINMKTKVAGTESAKSSGISSIDELEDFAMGRPQNNVNERSDVASSEEEIEPNSAAAASAAAMKEAMDRAEAKFKHAREVRERERDAKSVRSREFAQQEGDDKLMQDAQEREFKEKQERLDREREQREMEEKEREKKRLERERERERIEREKARYAVERATREARERAAAEARTRAERAAVEKANAEARERAERAAVQRAAAEARERAASEARERAEKAALEARERAAAEARQRAAAEARDKAATEARERAAVERAAAEVRARAERAAVERANTEARERAAAVAREKQQRNENDLDSFFGMGARPSSAPRQRSATPDSAFDAQFQSGGYDTARRTPSAASSSIRKASSATNIVDDLTSIFGATPSAGDFQEVEGESEERRRARLDRHQRTRERAAKALAEKNERDMQTLRDQAERHRIAETLDVEIKRWAAGKEGNLRALLSTLQYVLWPECGWQPVSLTDLITGASVKKVYRKATLCIHPDKVQQKGANLQQKYVAEKVFDLLKEAWNKFNSEELF